MKKLGVVETYKAGDTESYHLALANLMSSYAGSCIATGSMPKEICVFEVDLADLKMRVDAEEMPEPYFLKKMPASHDSSLAWEAEFEETGKGRLIN